MAGSCTIFQIRTLGIIGSTAQVDRVGVVMTHWLHHVLFLCQWKARDLLAPLKRSEGKAVHVIDNRKLY